MSAFQLSRKSTFDLLICIVSIILIVAAPNTYSYKFCLLIHNLFLFTFLYNLWKNRKEGILGFNLLFSVSFYYTSFYYPVFMYNTVERYHDMFGYGFDENLISYCTAVAYTAYCFLQLGLNNVKINPVNTKTTFAIPQRRLKSGLMALSIIFMVTLLYFLSNGGLYYFADQFLYEKSDNDRLMGYVVQFMAPIAYAMVVISFMLKKKRCFEFYFSTVLIILFVVAVLSAGSRTIPLGLMLMAVMMYNDRVKKIPLPLIIVLGIAAVLILTFVGSLRGGGEMISAEKISQSASEVIDDRTENSFAFAHELIICNRNLYSLIGSTKTVSYTYGISLLSYFLGMIPFMQALFLKWTGVPYYLLNSAQYNTFLSVGKYSTRGLGTHVVSDIYVCWGLIGVIVIFYLYGYLISYFKNKSNNIYATIAYYVIVSNAIYACRSSIFNLRSILWTIIIVYIVLNIKLVGQRYRSLTTKTT